MHGTSAFEMCTTAMAQYFSHHGITMYPYINDLCFILESKDAESKFAFANETLIQLRLPINKDKLVPPAKSMNCLGICIDLVENTLSIDKAKLSEIKRHCDSIQYKKFLSTRAFYIHKCVRPARIFMNRMLALFCSHWD